MLTHSYPDAVALTAKSRRLKMRYCISLSALLITFFINACSVNPVTGQSEFTLMSPQQEVAAGEQNYRPAQQSQGGQYRVDPGLSDYVSRVGQKLAQVSDNRALPYEFVVLNNDVPNAWALPGGKIAVNRGLLIHLEDEAQLAAVLGHEIVHAAARHSAQQMTQSALLGLGAAVLGTVSSNNEFGGLLNQGTAIGAAAWQARYGRENELEADDYGMTYMSRAGYDPQAAVELQETFVRLSESRQTDFISGLFASHPPSQARVAANQRHAQNLGGGERNRQAYQQAISQIKKDQPAYETHQQAIEQANNKQFDQAMALVDKALQMQNRENHFWETKGLLQARAEDYQSAKQSFSQAIQLNPSYFRPYYLRGSVNYQQKDFAEAEQDLGKSQDLMPTQNTAYLLGQVSLRLGKTQQAVEYFRQVAAAGGEIGQAAEQELRKLGVAAN
jgi:predicted Zn-dependent protease